MNTDTLQFIEVPLKQLISSIDNVRTTAADHGIEELAASISAVGLLQSLVVRKQARGKFAVIAGRRRLLALSRLASSGALKATWPVPCRLAGDDADLTEISLTENVMRVPMHPADEFVAFQKLIVDGKCVADVAARFGVSEALVNRRLALARVSPALLQQYREGNLNLDLLQAFTLTDDHSKQEELWASLPQWERNAQAVRRRLSLDSIPATDKCVRFVGLENYEAAGGALKRDLFAEGDQGIQILNPATLSRLAGEKLQALADQVRAEGWKWVEVPVEGDYQAIARMRRVPAPIAALPAKQEAKLRKLIEKREALEAEVSEEDEEIDERLQARMDELDEAIYAIERSRTPVYPEEFKAICGVAITIDQDGEPAYTRGLIRKEDEKALAQPSTPDISDSTPRNPDSTGEAQEAESASYSASLIESLTMRKTAAIAVELSRRPLTALAALVHALVLKTFGLDLGLYRSETSIQIATTQPHLGGAKDSPALVNLDQQRQEWLTVLPREASDLWQWCFAQNQDVLLRLLAFITASSLNAVQGGRPLAGQSDGKARIRHADQLAGAMEVDMTPWFSPTAENFFGKVSKAQTMAALQEAGRSIPDASKLKKAELAHVAEKELQGTGWLPLPLRVAAVSDNYNG